MRKKDKPDSRETPEAVAERLRAVYASRYIFQGGRNNLSRRLFDLTDKAGIAEARKTPRSKRHTLYPRAVAKVGEDFFEAQRLRKELAAAEDKIEELRKQVEDEQVEDEQVEEEGAEPEAGDAAAPARRQNLYSLTVRSDLLHNVGLVRGDECDVLEAGDLKVGDAAAVEEAEGAARVTSGRVVSIDAEHITIRNEGGEHTYNRAEVYRVGRINILNPRKSDPLNPKQRARVNKLRKDLESLGAEDDQIIRCTRRYKLEKEIFDITHPPAGLGDWSEWEEAGDAV